ncbi:MAG: hypothetical protein E4H24_04045 [Thermomicrobiales bacterium]|jgi:hypothetical protein|nr:MAG: hypothetical protein E4H24_04045 [Thermomicrobiales bacterium]
MIGDRWRRDIDLRPRSGAAFVAAVMLVVAACGGGDPSAVPATNQPVASATSQPGASEAPEGGLADQTFSVGEHFWHSGFRVEVEDGEILSTTAALTGKVTTTLTLAATLENLGVDTGFFGPSVAIATNNNSYPAGVTSNDIPSVPGGLKSQGTFAFRIDEDFDLASAELVIGDSDENQARIPLSGSGEAVRLEPSEPDIAGTLSMDLVDLVITSAALQYDNLDRHQEIDKGKQALVLNFDVVNRKSGNWSLFAKDLALIMPDGTASPPEGADLGSVPGTDEGVTTAGKSAWFLVDEMPAGAYTLRFTPGSWFVGADGVTEAAVDFTIE